MTENLPVWKEYAYKAGIHGSIISYLDVKKENFYTVETTVAVSYTHLNDNKWKDISEKMKTNLSTFSKSMGEKAGDLLLQMEISLHETYDYRKFLRKFTVMNEEIKLDLDSFDYIFYTYGLNTYGNVRCV